MTTFEEHHAQVIAEAEAEGPEAVAQLRMFEDRYRLASDLIGLRRERSMTQQQFATASGIRQSEISRRDLGRQGQRLFAAPTAPRDRSSAQTADPVQKATALTTKALENAYDIAMQLMTLRERQGLTQAQLAALCGVDQTDISRIERGGMSPTTRTLQRIAEALHADVRLVVRAL